jgi:hypothetical protein
MEHFDMNTASKILATGLLLGASSLVSAVPMLTVTGPGIGAANAGQATFLGSVFGAETEDFENGYTVGSQSQTISSSGVATFESLVAGSGGACDNGAFDCSAGLSVLDARVSPYNGRFSVPTDADNTNWLDSMDAKEMSISVATGYNAIGFFMTDPNDSGGRFEIGGVGFDFEYLFGNTSLSNGQVYYISIFDNDVATLGDVVIKSNASGDGYGIDRVTVAKVPEPGTLALFGLGLVGLGLARRRKQA